MREFASNDEIPPRRTGYNIIALICSLLAALFLLLYVSLWIGGSHTDPLIERYVQMITSPTATDNQRNLTKEDLDRIIQYNDSSRKALFDFTEKVGLALISLLSAVVGYTLKGEATTSSD